VTTLSARHHPVAPLVVRTVEIDDPGELLALLPSSRGLAWVRHRDGFVGWGEAARFAASGPERFAAADAWWAGLVERAVVRDDVEIQGSGALAFGSFAFDDVGPSQSMLIVPEVVVGRRAGRCWVTTIAAEGGLPPAPALPERPPAKPPSELAFSDGALSGAEWELAVAEAVRRIGDGPLEKVVLARDLEVRTATDLDERWPLSRLAQRYSACWTFAVGGLIGATPEMLVRLERGLVMSRVLAGTIRRTGDDAHDLALAASLARSSKDLEEHEYAVRSVAEALGPHCTSTNVPETPFVLHLPNVMHLATDVAGVVRDDASVLGLVAALHPSAAVCGTPTDLAQVTIRELEQMDRGRYAGPVGWIGANGDGEFAIALRCAQVEGERLRLYAGCGVVAGSDPEAELAEAQAKFVAMRDALACD
jgi:menaquinone-specific isochorismate synthase